MDTPATDSEAFNIQVVTLNLWNHIETSKGVYVSADFARELERKVNEYKEVIRKLRAIIPERYQIAIDSISEQVGLILKDLGDSNKRNSELEFKLFRDL
jgi:hypothetical protein